MAAPVLRFDAAGESYRAPRLCALDQHLCLRAVEPVLAGLREAFRLKGRDGALQPVLEALQGMSDDEVETLVGRCLRTVERNDTKDEWVPVWDTELDEVRAGGIGLTEMVALTATVVWTNLGPFIDRDAAKFDRRGEPAPDYEQVSMADGLSWLLTPVRRGMCKMESLLDGSLDLSHVAMMNEAMVVEAENESRAHAAMKRANSR